MDKQANRSADFDEQPLIQCQVAWGVATTDHFSDHGERCHSIANNGNLGSEFDRIAVAAGADTREGSGLNSLS